MVKANCYLVVYVARKIVVRRRMEPSVLSSSFFCFVGMVGCLMKTPVTLRTRWRIVTTRGPRMVGSTMMKMTEARPNPLVGSTLTAQGRSGALLSIWSLSRE